MIPFSTLDRLHSELSSELKSAFDGVLSRGWFINGCECESFEKEFSQYCGVNYCVGCGNGLDSLTISLMSFGIGPGDEVIVPAFTFIATAIAIEKTGAVPVFVDVESDTSLIDVSQIEKVINSRTKAIIPVYLYGQIANMSHLKEIADNHNLMIIADAAQAHGASYDNKKIGTLANATCFSFYPGKNLGALGDGGAIVTDSNCYQKMKMITNYGSMVRYRHDCVGMNSRLDELQAAFLRVKLKVIQKMIDQRKRIARRYLNEITNPNIMLPVEKYGSHVWHIFSIHVTNRDELQQYLKLHDIETNIHYPIPIHLQPSFSKYRLGVGSFPITEQLANTELSLPLYYGMTDEEITFVIDTINRGLTI